jgi:hypothetical protein
MDNYQTPTDSQRSIYRKDFQLIVSKKSQKDKKKQRKRRQKDIDLQTLHHPNKEKRTQPKCRPRPLDRAKKESQTPNDPPKNSQK